MGVLRCSILEKKGGLVVIIEDWGFEVIRYKVCCLVVYRSMILEEVGVLWGEEERGLFGGIKK